MNPMIDPEQLAKYVRTNYESANSPGTDSPKGDGFDSGGSQIDRNGGGGNSPGKGPGGTPDTTDRYMKAKLKMLQKQNDE
jgi:hypothetical protein